MPECYDTCCAQQTFPKSPVKSLTMQAFASGINPSTFTLGNTQSSQSQTQKNSSESWEARNRTIKAFFPLRMKLNPHSFCN